MGVQRLIVSAVALLASGSVLLASSGIALADDKQKATAVDDSGIAPQGLDTALQEFAERSGLQVIYLADVAKGKRSQGAEADLSNQATLDQLLASTDLEYEFLNGNTVTLRAADRQAQSDSRQPTLASGPTPRAAAPASGNDSVAAAAERAASSDEADGAAQDEDEMEEIIVTGSQLITDPGKLTRQITVFNRAEIERSGATRLDEFLRRLPQNMNAPNSVGAGFGGRIDFGLGENLYAGSTINLRGLGSQYTLILIDGRRPARGGQYGDVTDISTIPIDRIERIEVLFDGAAAIYGADAVGGVVNIITRKDYGGTNLSLTYNDTEDGGGARANLQLGHTLSWRSGSLTATVGYQTQEAIEGNQRGGVQLSPSTADLFGNLFVPPSANGNIRAALSNFDLTAPEYRALFWVNGDERLTGGVEVPAIRLITSGELAGQFVETTVFVDRENPQMPFGYFWIDEAADRPQNPATLGFTPVFQADLPQYSGQPLRLDEVSASNELGESVYSAFDGLALSPEDDTYNLGLNLNQDLSSDVRLALNADYSVTNRVVVNNEVFGRADVPADNPSNPFGQPFSYSYNDLLPQQYRDIEVISYNVSGGIDWDFAPDWSLAFGFGYSGRDEDMETVNHLRTGQGVDALQARFNGYGTVTMPGGSLVREFTGSNFNDPSLGYGSIEGMIDALVRPFQRSHTYSTNYDADLRLTGKLFELPGGDIRFGLLAGYREDETEVFSDDTTVLIPPDGRRLDPPDDPSAGFADYDERFGENVKSLQGEVSVPVFGSDFDLPLVDTLLLSLSGGLEEYSATEENGFNWAAGFNWGVTDQFVVRLNRTYNLRVPESVRTAQDPRWGYSPTLTLYANVDDQFPAAIVEQGNWAIRGGANHLVPERNYGTSLSFIYRPAFAEGLDLQVNLTQSRTVDQLGNPFSSGILTFDTVLPESVRANPLLDFGDPENNAFHASAANVIGGEIIRMAPGDLIFDRREYNIGDTFNRGADFQISYNLATRFGDWLLTWRHQYLDKNEVRRSNLCEQVEIGCNIDSGGIVGVDEPIDTVGSVSRDSFGTFALPRNGGSIDLFWEYRGLGVNLFTQYVSTTSVFTSEDITEDVVVGFIEFNGQRIPITERQFLGTNFYREDSRPEQTVNVSLSYDFARGSLFGAPGWLGDARIALTIDNLYQISERKQSKTVVLAEAEGVLGALEAELNRFTVRPRGRAYTLLFSTTF